MWQQNLGASGFRPQAGEQEVLRAVAAEAVPAAHANDGGEPRGPDGAVDRPLGDHGSAAATARAGGRGQRRRNDGYCRSE